MSDQESKRYYVAWRDDATVVVNKKVRRPVEVAVMTDRGLAFEFADQMPGGKPLCFEGRMVEP